MQQEDPGGYPITESRTTVNEPLVPFGSLVWGSCVFRGRPGSPGSDGALPSNRPNLEICPGELRPPGIGSRGSGNGVILKFAGSVSTNNP